MCEKCSPLLKAVGDGGGREEREQKGEPEFPMLNINYMWVVFFKTYPEVAIEMQMCVYCHEGDVVKEKKKNRQYPELEIAPWAKGRCWVRTQTCREDRKKEVGTRGGKRTRKK